jgi:methylglyoxal reductase
MIYRSIANGQLKPSILTFGCWPLGEQYWGSVDVTKIEKAIRAALEVGINCFDTAPLYGNGVADQRLVESLGSDRHDVIIATKVGARLIKGHAQSDLSASFIQQDVEASLKRLNIDSIPLLQVHWPCQQGTPLRESFEALAKLKEAGKIQHIGVCNYPASKLKEILSITPIASLQTPFSLIRREFEQHLQTLCTKHNLAVFAYEGLCRGLLSGKYHHPPLFSDEDLRSRDARFQGDWFWHTRDLLNTLKDVSRKTNIPTTALVLGWLSRQPTISSVVVGIKTEAQLRENISSLQVVNRDNLISIITRITNIHGGYSGSR